MEKTSARSPHSFDSDLITGEHFTLVQKDELLSQKTGSEITYKIAGTKWSPEQANGNAIIYVHGFQSHRKWFYQTAESCRDRGFRVYAFDRIGSGESEGGKSLEGSFGKKKLAIEKGHIRDYQLFLDTLALTIDFAAKAHPEDKIHIWANSYGAKIVTAYLLSRTQHQQLEKVVFTTPGLYLDNKSLPLPFNKYAVLLQPNLTSLPSQIAELDGDNGAHLFTSQTEGFEKIKTDPLGLRYFTKSLGLQTRLMDRAIESLSKKTNILEKIPRLYLLVKQDPMMDNQKMLEHIKWNRKNAFVKIINGGPDHRHFISYTEDAPQALTDICAFLLNEEVLGLENL